MSKKRPNQRIALARLLKQVEVVAEAARFELRTPEARERYALIQSMARAAGIQLCCRNTEGLRRLGEPAEEFLSDSTLAGHVFSPHSRAEDYLGPNADLIALANRQTMLREPDVAAEIPMFDKHPVGARKTKARRREAADELRAIVVAHIKVGAHTFPGAGTLHEQLALYIMGFLLVDESPISVDVRSRMPSPRSAQRQEQWQKMLTLVARRIETAMQTMMTPDAEVIVRQALDELGYSGRKNASLYEAAAAKEKYDLKKSPRSPAIH